MAGSVLVFLAILGGAVFLAALLKRRVAETIPLSVVFLIAHTYLCGLIGLLKFSVFVTVFGMIALGAAGLYLSVRRRGRWQLQWDLSVLFFALGFAWILYISNGRMALSQSEYTQWALAPKAMFYMNSLTPDGVTAVSPALAVFQTVFETMGALLAPGDGFRDWLLYAAYGTACLALLLPVLTSAHPRRLVRAGYALLFFLAIVCVPLQFFGLFSALSPDGLLALLAAASFLSAARSKSIAQAAITGVYLFALKLVKDAGLFFALGALAVYFITLLRSEEYKQSSRGRRIALLAVPALCVLLARLTWPHLSFSLHAAAESAGLYWQSFAAKLIAVRVGLTLGSGTLFSLITAHLSYLALTILFAGFTMLLVRALKAREGLRNTRTALLYASGSAALYGIGLWLAYLFAINAADAAKLAGFERLLSVGYVFWALVLIAAALRLLAEKPSWTWRRHLFVLLSCVAVIFTGSGALSELSAREFTAENERYQTYYAIADEAKAAIPEDARVYIVSQNDDGSVFNTLRYALYPRRVNPETTDWLRDPSQKPNAWAYAIAPGDWKAGITDYDYVLVYRTDGYLQTAIAQAVDAEILANTIYRVNRDTGALTPAGE